MNADGCWWKLNTKGNLIVPAPTQFLSYGVVGAISTPERAWDWALRSRHTLHGLHALRARTP